MIVKKPVLWMLLSFAVIGFCLIPQAGQAQVAKQETDTVRLGIDNIDNYLPNFANKRVGLITNATGMNSNFESTIDILYRKTKLVALFSPEHGIRGAAKAGDEVGNLTDAKTGLPVHSLYGATKKPTAQMLKDIDILAFDIQDVGARPYTYIYTLAYAMQSAKEQGKTVVVFDRPNPIGGVEVEGGVVKPGYESFIGMYPIPSRHGLTVGELARLFNSEFGIGCDLVVVKMTGWHRAMYFADTGLPWVMTSPNIPTPDTALVYPGMGLFGGTNVSEGIGTTRPFEFVGAPWLNADFLTWRLNRLELPGVVFRPAYFTPQYGLYQGEQCAGVQLHITDRRAFKPVRTAITLLYEVKELGGDHFKFKRPNGHDGSIDLIAGDDSLRMGRLTQAELLDRWAAEADRFTAVAKQYYLYD